MPEQLFPAPSWGDLDVRTIVDAVCRDTMSRSGIPWSAIPHGYGDAGAVPELLDQLTGPDPDAAKRAMSGLWTCGFVEGMPTAAGALITPFALRAALRPETSHRHEPLLFAARSARQPLWDCGETSELLRSRYPDPWLYDVTGYVVDWSITAARQAIGAHAGPLAAALDDPDPVIRRVSAFALATALPPTGTIVAALSRRLSAETDPSVQASLVLAATQLQPSIEAARGLSGRTPQIPSAYGWER